MGKFGDSMRRRLPADGKAAKALSIIYFIWLYVTLMIIINTYPTANHTVSAGANWLTLVLSIAGSLTPAFIAMLHKGAYVVLFYGGYRRSRQRVLARMDERELGVRRQVFEKSYTLLATIILLAVFLQANLFGGGSLSQDGAFAVGFNLIILVISLPSIVATWDKRASAGSTADD